MKNKIENKNKMRFVIFSAILLTVLPSIVFAQVVTLTTSGTTVPASLEPGEKGNLILSITNVGTTPARDMKLAIRPHVSITPDQFVYNLQTLGAGSSVQIAVPISVATNAPEGTTALFFAIDYKESDTGGTRTLENSVSISITKRALIEIKNVTYNKEIISRGDTILMTVTFENVGRGRFKDLTLSLNNANLPFVPAATDTESYVGNVEPGQQKLVNFNIIINRDADTKAYSVPVVFSFFDESGNSKTESKFVGLKISGRPEFVVTVDKTENLFAGATGTVTFSIANRGTAAAQFLTTYFNTSEMSVSYAPTESYVGNLDPDDTSTVTFDISFAGKPAGTYELPLVLAYKDPYNQEFSETKNIELKVTNMPIEIPLTVQVAIAAVVLFVIYWKRQAIFHLKARLTKKK